MKSDIDDLMKDTGLDAIMVLGNAGHNPPMTYLTGGGHVNHAVLLKNLGQEAVLFCNVMERDEAARSGLKIVSLPDKPTEVFCGEDGLRLFRESGLTNGKVGIFGSTEAATTLRIIENVTKELPNIKFLGLAGEKNIFLRAMETKDSHEVERIRKMGKITVDVVGRTADYLRSCEVREDEVLLKEDDTPLTVGDMHSKIRLWVSELGVELPAGFIFSIGRDAAVPHSTGTVTDLIRLGKTIIFDIYPAEAGGGYFYDFTRTWSLGYATPKARELFDQVREIYSQLQADFSMHTVFKTYEIRVCDFFEGRDHPTKRTHPPAPLEGYVHSLGHGVGLNIHERPHSAFIKPDDNKLNPGVVFTIEPGLYYPDREIGIRIEDTFWMNPNGNVEVLADYPYDFVLPMKKWTK